MKLPGWFLGPPSPGLWWAGQVLRLAVSGLLAFVAWRAGHFWTGVLWGAFWGFTVSEMRTRPLLQYLRRTCDVYQEQAMAAHKFILELGKLRGMADQDERRERDFTRAN